MDLKTIKLADIYRPEAFNCRGHINKVDVVDLARDIEKNGLIQPVVLSPNNCGTPEHYKLISGFSRVAAHEVLERDEILAIIHPKPLDEMQSMLINLSENLQRRDLDISQEAMVVNRLMTMGASENKIAQAVSKSRGWVQIRTMYLKLHVEIQRLVDSKHITHPQVRDLYSVQLEHGMAEAVDAAYRLKQAKAQGKKISIKAKKKKDPTAKKVRTRSEMFAMQSTIREAMGNNTATKVLAWAAGEISTLDLCSVLEIDYVHV